MGTDAALVLAVVSLLANSVLQQLIQPFVMGATLSLNPLVVLVVTIGAGALFGMVGLTLAAPLTSAAVHIANELRARADGSVERRPGAGPLMPPESVVADTRRREISSHVGGVPDPIGRSNEYMTPATLLNSLLLRAGGAPPGLLVTGLLLIAGAAGGCGESDEEKAQTQVCDARADLKKQVDDLAALTPGTATADGVKEDLSAVENDLNQIKDAQGDLSEERRQEVESATQESTSDVEAVANDLRSDLSSVARRPSWRPQAKQLASSYQQTFAQIDCE